MATDLGFSMGFHGYNYGKNVPNHQPAWGFLEWGYPQARWIVNGKSKKKNMDIMDDLGAL